MVAFSRIWGSPQTFLKKKKLFLWDKLGSQSTGWWAKKFLSLFLFLQKCEIWLNGKKCRCCFLLNHAGDSFSDFFANLNFLYLVWTLFLQKKTPGAAKRCIFLSGLKSLWRCCDNFWWPSIVNIKKRDGMIFLITLSSNYDYFSPSMLQAIKPNLFFKPELYFECGDAWKSWENRRWTTPIGPPSKPVWNQLHLDSMQIFLFAKKVLLTKGADWVVLLLLANDFNGWLQRTEPRASWFRGNSVDYSLTTQAIRCITVLPWQNRIKGLFTQRTLFSNTHLTRHSEMQ